MPNISPTWILGLLFAGMVVLGWFLMMVFLWFIAWNPANVAKKQIVADLNGPEWLIDSEFWRRYPNIYDLNIAATAVAIYVTLVVWGGVAYAGVFAIVKMVAR